MAGTVRPRPRPRPRLRATAHLPEVEELGEAVEGVEDSGVGEVAMVPRTMAVGAGLTGLLQSIALCHVTAHQNLSYTLSYAGTRGQALP